MKTKRLALFLLSLSTILIIIGLKIVFEEDNILLSNQFTIPQEDDYSIILQDETPCGNTISSYSSITDVTLPNNDESKATIVDIKQAGAYGDGIHDDSSIISTMLNSIQSNQSLYFPEGTYLISSDIVCNNTNNVKMDGNNATIISNTSATISFLNVSSLYMSNLQYEGLNRIKLIGNENVIIEKCSFKNMKYYGLILYNDNDTMTAKYLIDNCTFIGTGSTLEFLKNTNYGAAANDIRISRCYADSITISNCEMSGTMGHSPIFIYPLDNYRVNYYYIENNKIHDIAFRGIEIWQYCTSKGSINHNEIFNCGTINPTNSGVGCNGIYSHGGAPYLSVEDNIIYNVYENGIEGTFKNISRNYIHDTGIDPINHPTPSPEGIYGQTPIIEDNVLQNIAGFAIGNGTYSYNISEDIYIRGNTISNETTINNSAIHYWGGVSTDRSVILEDNSIEGYRNEVYYGTNSPTYIY